mgnify:CR=1 FL=1
MNNWDLYDIMTKTFYGNPPNKKDYKNIIEKLLKNIKNARKTPIENHKFVLW